MVKLSIDIKQDYLVTSEEVADLFCNMDGDEQARFFNKIAALSALWDQALCFQLQTVTDSLCLSDEGRRVMRMIGEYSEQSKKQ